MDLLMAYTLVGVVEEVEIMVVQVDLVEVVMDLQQVIHLKLVVE
jgi:hypothetical protein